MKRLLALLIALGVAVAIGISIYRYPAVIVIGFGAWRIDLPFWIGILLLVIFYLVLHVVLAVWRLLYQAARSLAHFGTHYRKHRAKALIRRGLLAEMEGDYLLAEKSLAQSAQYSETPWMAYLTAAKAAQLSGDEKKAEQYLQHAQVLAPDSAFAIALIRAQHCLHQKQYEQAVHWLLPWSDKKPNAMPVLSGLKEAYSGLENWEKLSHLLPRLKRSALFSKEAYTEFENDVWQKRLTKTPAVKVPTVWQEMPNDKHTQPDCALIYAKTLMQNKQIEEAESVLKHAIKQKWDERLVRCYGRLTAHPHSEKLLATAEGWIERHTESAVLFLTLGRLCLQVQLWGKAQRYLETSVGLTPSVEAYSELARLSEKLNRLEQSNEYYKKGLLLIAPGTPYRESMG